MATGRWSRSTRSTPRADALALGAVAALVAGYAVLLVWDAFQYDWLRGYDAWNNWRYEQAIERGTLPSRSDTDEWHNPPLFYALARVAQWIGDQRAVQLLNVAAGLGLVVFAFLIARELFRRSRTAQISALLFAMATPVLLRGSIMYHPDALAALFAVAAIFVVVRALARGETTVRYGVAAGVLVGLACLTRTSALAVLAALTIVLVGRWRMLLGLAVAALVLTAPWLVYKGIRFGSPLAYSQPVAAQWKQHGRPASFYIGLAPGDVFSSPYAPHYRNQLLPVVYSDWWGDYWRYFRVPLALVNEPPRLPDPYHPQLVRQSYVGILPSALALIGFVGVGWSAVRRRTYPALAMLAPLVLVGVAYVAFLVKYPKLDGDNIKALYVLDAVVPLAVCGGWIMDRLLRLSRLVFAAFVLLLAYAAVVDVSFLVLP